MEAEKGLPVSFLCDRHTTKVCTWAMVFSGLGFIFTPQGLPAPLCSLQLEIICARTQVNKSQVGFIKFMITPFFSSFCNFLKSSGNNASVRAGSGQDCSIVCVCVCE